MEKQIIFGFILIFSGILLIINSISAKANAKFAFGGFLGPIPFGFANNPELLKIIIILCLIGFIVFYFIKM
ncbi:MAG: hypothetical protein B6U87_00330 [Candidatus Aenigmarchaeota archaeon ex4484_52]|nr:MAG: hypothetical protein B6U87_00330 [Candidatus Aenigmarchaeota archaeon ex4484_52]